MNKRLWDAMDFANSNFTSGAEEKSYNLKPAPFI